MDLDSQEKEELFYADELDFDDDLGFDNPFADLDADTVGPEVQSLQEEFAMAAGHFDHYQPLDFRVIDAAEDAHPVALFGGFADPAAGLGQVGLIEEEPVRLRRAEAGRYGFDIVIRGGRAYPAAMFQGDVLAEQRGELQPEQNHWQGVQQQQGVLFRGVLGETAFGGLRGALREELGLVGGFAEDPVEGVGVCEHAPQAQAVAGFNPLNNWGEGNNLYIDPQDLADLRGKVVVLLGGAGSE